jgi:hypothetical protein
MIAARLMRGVLAPTDFSFRHYLSELFGEELVETLLPIAACHAYMPPPLMKM